MSQDSYTEVTHQSWGSRLSGSLKGIVVGFVLIAVAISALWWNEGRAIKRTRALEEGAGQVVNVTPDRVDATNESKLIHLSGRAMTQETLSDPDFGIQAQAIKLNRSVEMYQWQEQKNSETREKLGGGTETITTYSYSKGWSSSVINTSSFKKPEGHQNPGHMPYKHYNARAQRVTLGEFTLSPSLISEINQSTPIALTGEEASTLRLPNNAQISDNEIYIGPNPGSPQIGDVRIYFSAVYPMEVSVVSLQRGNSFQPYVASNGNEVELLEYGVQSAEQMFQAAHDRNAFLTWAIRLGGFIGIFIGIRMLLGTLRVLAAVVPMIGRLVGGAIGLLAFILALVIALITIALAWIFYRPLLGIGLLVAAGAALFGLKKVKGESQPQAVPAAAGGPPSAPPPPPPM
jgi:tetrahydromethanopterin S-methyltransferase subunit G